MSSRMAGDLRTGDDRAGHFRQAPLLRLVMLGPPGAGKGTQAARVSRERRVPRISTGDILRQAIASGTAVDESAQALMAAGRLVEDDLVIGIVQTHLTEADGTGGFVLDGFPRTLVQAEALDHLVDHRSPLVVVDIEVPEEALVQRISERRICAVCGTNAAPNAAACAKCGGALVKRADDSADVVRERLRVYQRDTQSIVEFYRRRPTFRSVDGDQTQDLVAADIAAAVASVERVRV
jgi:adenylate kinase